MSAESLAPSVKRRGLFTDDQFQRFLNGIVDLTEASKVERGTREPGKPQVYQNVPDNPIRLGALRLAIELEIGKAPQSLDINLPNGSTALPSGNDAVKLLLANPDLAQRLLSDAFIQTMKKAQKAGEHIDLVQFPTSKPESQSVTSQR